MHSLSEPRTFAGVLHQQAEAEQGRACETDKTESKLIYIIMYKITWDKETGGVQLHSRIVDGTLGITPRPVFWEELDLLELDKLGRLMM